MEQKEQLSPPTNPGGWELQVQMQMIKLSLTWHDERPYENFIKDLKMIKHTDWFNEADFFYESADKRSQASLDVQGVAPCMLPTDLQSLAQVDVEVISTYGTDHEFLEVGIPGNTERFIVRPEDLGPVEFSASPASFILDGFLVNDELLLDLAREAKSYDFVGIIIIKYNKVEELLETIDERYRPRTVFRLEVVERGQSMYDADKLGTHYSFNPMDFNGVEQFADYMRKRDAEFADFMSQMKK